jgi:hypothetical protein
MLYRSGKPQHINGTTSGTQVDEWVITEGKTLQLDFQNTDAANDIELFLSKAAADKGAGYGFIVPARAGFEFEVEIEAFYTLSSAAATFTSIAACRP